MRKTYYLLFSLTLLFSSTAFGQMSEEVLANEIALTDFTEPAKTKPAAAKAIKALDPNGFMYDFKNLNINTKYSEYATAFFRDKIIVASSKKIGAFFGKVDKNTNEGFHDLYCGDHNLKGDIKNLLNFSRSLNTKDNHEGSIAFTTEQNVIYFTRSIEENGQHNLKIFKAELVDYQWTNVEKLPFNVEGYAIENPVLSPDDTHLYFSSNIPGTVGGYDLFSVAILEDGTYGKPVNLGQNINTHKDEKFPYIMGDSSALYFSSNGHYNLGGLDVFESKIVNGTFAFPVNMGSSLNSPEDDFGFMMDQTNSGFFTSNRQGGKGGNDIYYFHREKISQTLYGTAVDKNTKMVLPNTEITLSDAYGRVVETVTTDEKGVFTTSIAPYNSYSITASKEGFENSNEEFESFRGEDKYKHEITIEMKQTKAEIVKVDDKVMIQIENIYFDYNKWNIKDESTLSLNKVVDVLQQHPEMNIEINAHTDTRGSDKYNYSLSEKRAASARAYLISKGISSDRMISNGYGETKPIENCNADCTENQHETNRRIEFVILNF